jgi:probable HAF family extracellular repeat protein
MIGLGVWGGISSQATDINERGQIVGSARTGGSSFHAVLWDKGEFTELSTLGGQLSEARAINNAGVAVGFSTDVSGTYRGVIWRHGQVMLIAGLEIATDINGSGQVVGQTPGRRPALWNNGSLVELTDSPGQAFGINDAGQVVGTYLAPSGEQRAFLWIAGTLTDLGVANEKSEARAINNRGQVVGWVQSGGVTRPVIWDAGTRTELPNLGGSFGMAVDISNNGTILGSGSFTWGGPRAVVWTWSSRSRP